MAEKSYQDFEDVLLLYKKAQRIYSSGNTLIVEYGGHFGSFKERFSGFNLDINLDVSVSEESLEGRLKKIVISPTNGLNCGWIKKYKAENLKSHYSNRYGCKS